MIPGRKRKGRITIRDGMLPKMLVQALTDSGMDSVDVLDLVELLGKSRTTVEDVARDRIVVAWDVDYVDPQLIPLQDHRKVLVVRISVNAPRAELVQRIVRFVRTFRDGGFTPGVIVLDPGPPDSPPASSGPRSGRPG